MRKLRFPGRAWWLVPGLLVMSGAVALQEQSTLQTVERVDLDRYLGTWYEIARLPNRFQDHCRGNVTADYARLDDGAIEVVNRCLDNNGTIDEARGVARIVEPSSNSKLEVSFVSLFGFHLFWGDYWILDLGEEYEYSVVGMPSRKYGWILSRTTSMPPETWDRLRRVLTDAGYDPDKFLQTRHENLPAVD